MKAPQTAVCTERERELGNLTSDETTILLGILEKLSAPANIHDFRQGISEDLLRLLKSDVLASYLWNEDEHIFEDFVGLGLDPLNGERYLSYFQFHDPITCFLHKRRTATLVCDVMSQRDLEKTEFFNDFLMQDGQHHGMNLHAYDGDTELGDLRIWRTKGRPDFGRREIAILDTILPHFRNALLNAGMMHRAEGIEAFWTQLVDSIDVGLFLFDEKGSLLYLNDRARRIEKELQPIEYASLCSHVSSGVRENRLPVGWGPFSLSVLRMLSPENSRPVAAVLLHPRVPKPLTADLLRATYRLTPRETEICILVYKGLKDEEIARTLGIGFATVRTHMKRLFAKIEVASRSELVYCLLEGVSGISL